MKLKEFVSELNNYLQVNLFEDFCPNGLQVEGKGEIKSVAIAVSASLNVIKRSKNHDALIVHHGLFWNKDPYPITGTKKEKIKILLESGTSLLAYHLPLDAHEEVGNNFKAAKDLGWKKLERFGDVGVKGIFKPVKAADFRNRLEEYFGQKSHSILGGKDKIASAALISGGAYKELLKAKNAGVDAYITGSFDEPAYHQAIEEAIHFFACGHASTEKIGIKALGDYIKKKWKLKVEFIDEPNPF